MESLQLELIPYIGLAVAGLCSGVLAGLLGIGAGSLMVPMLVFFYAMRHLPLESTGLLAVATSLAAIVFLSTRAFWAHRRNNAGRFNHILWMAPAGIVGAWCGAQLAGLVGGRYLLLAFAGFECLVGLRYFLSRSAADTSEIPNVLPLKFLGIGALSGVVASFFGVGGGIVAVPLQLAFLRMPIHHAIANSSGLIALNALTGTVAYALAQPPTLPLKHIGWIDPIAATVLALTGLLAAPTGVRLAHRLAPGPLKRLFGLFLVVISVVLAAKAY